MEILNKDSYIDKSTAYYIALGSFDGIHKGHLTLINKAIALAKENSSESVVYTFINHPRDVLKINANPKLLLDNEQKAKIFEECLVHKLYFEEFNQEFMKLSAEEFIKYLCTKFNVKGIIIGFNYKFGYKNLGDAKLLKKYSKIFKYQLYIMPPATYKEKVISSTRIRNELSKGHIEDANEMLTRPFMLHGNVIEGRKIGRTIDFPTANLNYSKKSILPMVGVYYTNVLVNNILYRGITNIGSNPTVNGEEITIETHILDFNEDIYQKEITVFFLKWLRGEHKFESLERLKNQLNTDKAIAGNEKTLY